MKTSTFWHSPVDFHSIQYSGYTMCTRTCIRNDVLTIFIPSSTAIHSHFDYFLGFMASCTDDAMCIHITNPNILTPSVASRKRCHFTVLVKSPTAQQNSCFSPTTIPVHDFYLHPNPPPPTHTHTHTSPLLWIYVRPPALTIQCLHMLQIGIYSPHQ